MGKYDCLKLETQLCFPLYVCSKEIIRKYKPYLDPLGLTYTQYIAMMVMWERKKVNVKELGERLYLDSGTLTPLLKKMEDAGLLTRKRSGEDERVVNVKITDKGMKLRDKCLDIPAKVGGCVCLKESDIEHLFRALHAILNEK
jgi:DNA-binding MarR family transcriptional regulator